MLEQFCVSCSSSEHLLQAQSYTVGFYPGKETQLNTSNGRILLGVLKLKMSVLVELKLSVQTSTKLMPY